MSYQFKHYTKGNTVGSGSYVFRNYTTQVAPVTEYFITFSGNNTFSLNTASNAKNWDGTLEYSTDKTTWNTWNGSSISSSNDGKLYIRGTSNTYITSTGANRQWVFSGNATAIDCSGNIENLLDYATVELGNHPPTASYCFRNLFLYNTKIANCGNLLLGTTTYAERCYQGMFYQATNLSVAPKFPSSVYVIVDSCFQQMFQGCTSLVLPPAFPTFQSGWRPPYYFANNMFYGCTNLIALPELAFLTIPTEAYYQMFYGCSKIKLSATQTGEYTIPYRLPSTGTGTVGNSALTNMFANTGGTFTGTPTVNTTYYLSNTNSIIPTNT